MKAKPRVAVLGAGIMGSSTALFLARRGADVSLFDAAAVPFSAASRWNEGKIHLGFIYSADPSLRTADHVIPGGLQFRPLMEDLIGTSIAPAITSEDDIYLCHGQSVVAPEAMGRYMDQVADRVRQHPDAGRYLADVSHSFAQKLTPQELSTLSESPDIAAGFRVPERSVNTAWIADQFVAALAAERRIELRLNTRVQAVQPMADSMDGPWRIVTDAGSCAPYDYVVNALWEGRLAIDLTAGLVPQGVWSNRYRQSLFLRTSSPIEMPCVVIAAGPFGDIKNYNRRDFYLSWYPAGLRADSSAIAPPQLDALELPEPQQLTCAILDHLESLLPAVARLRDKVESSHIGGGWVFAAGRGALSDPASTLHRRSDYGVTRRGTYLSVDTGKYSTAAWLARSIADEVMGLGAG